MPEGLIALVERRGIELPEGMLDDASAGFLDTPGGRSCKYFDESSCKNYDRI